jgi:hypothetical protein
MELEEGLKLALDGRALLFVGAGFSRGATNLEDNDFGLGVDLAVELSREANLPTGLQLDDAAELYVAKFGEAPLIDKLKLDFSAKTVTKGQEDIARVPWRRMYTTNYDDVFELACGNIGKRVDSVISLDDSSKISKRNLICVHLNGFIRRTDNDSVWNDLKLTQASYDNSSAMDTEWGSLFRAELQAAPAIFFVGYSLWDIDIRRLLFEEQLIDKTFFVLGVNPPIATAHRASKFGLLIAAGVDEFAAQVADFQKTYIPDDNPTPISFCLNLYESNVKAISMEDRSVFDLLLFGRLRPELVTATYLGQVNYCEPRSATDLALSRIDSGSKVIVVHSALGNGKTVTLEALKYLAHAKGYRVSSLVNRGETLSEEIQTTINTPGPNIFFIDNYVEWLDILPLFGTHQSENFVLVMSARSASHDVLVDRLERDLKTDQIFEVGVDKLEGEDIEGIVDYFDEFGVWGNQASLSRRRKIDHLKINCESEWHSILLRLLESPHIVEKLQVLLSALKRDGTYHEAIIRLLILAVLAYRPPTQILVSLCGDEILETGFRKDPVAQEIIEFGRTSVGVRSSVTAGVLLKEIVDPNVSIKALVGLIKEADSLPYGLYNNELFKSFVRFSNLHLIFPEKNRGRAGMRVYEAVKHLPRCKKSPLFWLQYAIAALVAQSFDRAKSYFKNAYSFADQLDSYDSYQIDNHYARFLLERVIFLKDSAAAMSAFREARVLIFSQLTNERLHYPFRVAAAWGTFYTFFRDDFSKGDKAEIRDAAAYVTKRIQALPSDRAAHRSIVDCWNAMQLILNDEQTAPILVQPQT